MNNRTAAIFKATKYFGIALIGFFFSLLNSCKEDTGSLGANVLPKSDMISAAQMDTTTIVTSMFLKDSALTSATVSSLLGSYNDPIFGESQASIYAEVSPSTYGSVPWSVGAGYGATKVDSVILFLPLSGQFGSLDPQTFEVYRTDSNIVAGTTYYSDKIFKLFNSTPIGTAQVTPPNSASTTNDTLRIKLSNNFKTYITNQVQFGSNWTTTFNANVMQGIYITTSNPLQLPGQGAMLYVNLNSSFAGIYVYYHYDTAATTPYYIIFPVGGSGGYFNHFNHNYSTSQLNATHPIGSRDSVGAGQFIYVQSMGGVSGRIYFPNLYKNWLKMGPVVINEAVVNLPVDQQDVSANFAPPTNLYLLSTGSNWQEWPLPDYAQPYYGGSYNGTSYTFIITQYIQSIINGKNDSDRGLYIVPGNSAISPNSVVLYGAQHGILPANKASLTLYYTPLKTP